MKQIIWLLAWRYLWGTQYERAISTMVRICFMGIFIGTCSLALVVCVMRGFEHAIYEKMQGIHADATLQAHGAPLDVPQITKIIKHNFPAVTALSPHAFKQVILQKPDTNTIDNVVVLQAIDPAQEHLVSSIERKIIEGSVPEHTLAALIHDDHILIGHQLADALMINPGDKVNILFTVDEQVQRKKVTFDQREVIVGGIFDTGIHEYDTNMALCSITLLKQLFPHAQVTNMNLRFAPGSDDAALIGALRNKLNLDVYSWKERYPALVSALKLEQYVMFFILLLITLVASMNIISLLFMHITRKRGDIAILQAMGASQGTITSIFLVVGMCISFFGSLAGLLAAYVIGLLLDRYPFITLPEDVYFVSRLPVQLEWHLFLIVFIAVMVISFFATWFSARQTHAINCAQVLRFEG